MSPTVDNAKEPTPSIMMAGLNREAWLEALVEKLRLHFADSGYPLGEKVHISVGFPSKMGLSRKKRRIGECWSPGGSQKEPHIFISPLIEDGLTVGGVVVHELGHAVLPPKTKHGPAFQKFMKAIGLEGKPTATIASEDLNLRLQALIEEIGPYPHAPLDPGAFEEEKPQTTRMLKLACPEHEDYIVRASRKVIELGEPICGIEACGKVMEEAA